MMKLWIVFYYMGHTSMVIGPVPYGMEECQRRVVAQKSVLHDDLENGLRAKDVEITCRLSKTRPAMEDNT